MTGGAKDLKPLVMSCLDDNPKNRPSIAQVSMEIKRLNDVCSQKSSRDGISPIVWWAEVSNEQQLQVTSSLEQLRRENDVLNTEVTRLKTNNDAMKDENEQLTTLLDKMAINNESQIQQINLLSSKNATMKDENEQLKSEVEQLKQQLVLKESTTPGDLFSGSVNIKWEEGAPELVSRVGHTAVWLNELLYVGGGYEGGDSGPSYTINCYDPVNNSWSSSINTACYLFAMTALNNKLLIAGGKDKDDKTTNQIFIMDSGHFNNYNKMTTARSSTTATGHQGMLIITGGWDNKGHPLSSTELFDSTNRQWPWYTCDDLPQPYNSLRSVIVDNVLYLLGGGNGYGYISPAVFTAPLDSLSRHQLKWNTHQDTPCCTSAPVTVFGTLLILGGRKKIGNLYLPTSDVYKLNKVSHSWEAIGHTPSAIERSAADSIGGNRIIVTGGKNDRYKDTNTVWIGSCEPQ